MTQDEIIRMAREAGFEKAFSNYGYWCLPENLEHFAALVAAHEREKLKNVAIFSSAVLAEREACAKVCDEVAKHYITNHKEQEQVWLLAATSDCAAAIRARGETK